MTRSGWSTETRSRRERGYGPDWDRLRKRILERDCYLCQCKHCKAEKLTTLAHEVDHIVPKAKGGTDAPSNLQAIARDCHKRKTAEDEGKLPREHVRVGTDGWPIT